MTKDLNKGISSISYNLLNLPQQVDILSPLAEARNVYSYSADGEKLRVVKKYNSNFNTSPVIGSAVNVSSMDVTKTTDYVDGKIFENNVLDRIFVDGGYIKGSVYYFYETDHLGDNRTVMNQSGTVVERNDYYPFGMQMAHNQLTNSASGSDNKRKFGGKELDVMHGLNLYDFEARPYDLNYINFWTPDPLAEDYPCWSSYVYCMNNPLRMIDPTGMAATDTINGGNLPPLVVTGKATSSGVITYYPDNQTVFQFYRMPQQERQMTISHLPLPGGSWKSIWESLKSIPSALKNIGAFIKTAKTAGFSNVFLSSLNKTISIQKQARHLAGSAPQGKGFLNSQSDAQKVLDAVHNGTAEYLGTSNQGHVIVKYTEVTGTNVNLGAGISAQPTNVFMIKGTSSPSVVPTSPNWTPK